MVSVGNFKECTVAVWDWQAGTLLSSSYTLDKINDIKIIDKVFSLDRVFEFATVGRDCVHFWEFNKENKLKYYDVYLKKDEDNKLPEITACGLYSHKN